MCPSPRNSSRSANAGAPIAPSPVGTCGAPASAAVTPPCAKFVPPPSASAQEPFLVVRVRRSSCRDEFEPILGIKEGSRCHYFMQAHMTPPPPPHQFVWISKQRAYKICNS